MIDIKSIFVGIGGLVIGALLSGVIVWGVGRVKISDALRDAANAKLEKENITRAWRSSLEELEKTKVTLEDTILTVRLLRQYQSIDNKTKEEINSIKETYDASGKPTKESLEKFKALLKEINERNNPPVVATVSVGNLDPFTELILGSKRLSEETDELLLEALDMLLEGE